MANQITLTIPEPLFKAFHTVQEALPVIKTAIVDTASKIAAFMKAHPYAVLSAVLALSLITMAPWISSKWVIHAICVESADMLNGLSYVFVAQMIYNIVNRKSLNEPSTNLLLTTSASIFLTLCGGSCYYYWFPPVFDIISQVVGTLGTIAAAHLAQHAFTPLENVQQA
jgi:hypothetical protein